MRYVVMEGKCLENFTALEILQQSLPVVLVEASKWLRREEE
jgi:hypothetical protein